MNDVKQRIMRLIERYGTARAQEELAGNRDAHGAVRLHHEAGQKAWNAICREIDVLTDQAPSRQQEGCQE